MLLTFVTAPLLLLYQTRPGRGRMEPMLEILIMAPPVPCFCMCGTTACTERYMDLTFTANTRSNSAVVTSSVGYKLISKA